MLSDARRDITTGIDTLEAYLRDGAVSEEARHALLFRVSRLKVAKDFLERAEKSLAEALNGPDGPVVFTSNE